MIYRYPRVHPQRSCKLGGGVSPTKTEGGRCSPAFPHNSTTAHRPSARNSEVCNALPVRRRTCGYLPSHRTSPAFVWRWKHNFPKFVTRQWRSEVRPATTWWVQRCDRYILPRHSYNIRHTVNNMRRALKTSVHGSVQCDARLVYGRRSSDGHTWQRSRRTLGLSCLIRRPDICLHDKPQ